MAFQGITINIMRHGDGKSVYVNIRIPGGGEFVLPASGALVYIDDAIPTIATDSQVQLRHGRRDIVEDLFFDRIKQLRRDGMTFEDAKATAEQELKGGVS